MKSAKSTLFNIVGFVKFKGKWIPRFCAIKMLGVCEMPEVHRELMAALYGHDTATNK